MDTLPSELLFEIFQYLDYETIRCVLPLVCHSLRDFTQQCVSSERTISSTPLDSVLFRGPPTFDNSMLWLDPSPIREITIHPALRLPWDISRLLRTEEGEEEQCRLFRGTPFPNLPHALLDKLIYKGPGYIPPENFKYDCTASLAAILDDNATYPAIDNLMLRMVGRRNFSIYITARDKDRGVTIGDIEEGIRFCLRKRKSGGPYFGYETLADFLNRKFSEEELCISFDGLHRWKDGSLKIILKPYLLNNIRQRARKIFVGSLRGHSWDFRGCLWKRDPPWMYIESKRGE